MPLTSLHSGCLCSALTQGNCECCSDEIINGFPYVVPALIIRVAVWSVSSHITANVMSRKPGVIFDCFHQRHSRDDSLTLFQFIPSLPLFLYTSLSWNVYHPLLLRQKNFTKCQCKVILGRRLVGTFWRTCVLRVKIVGLNKTIRFIFLFLKTT